MCPPAALRPSPATPEPRLPAPLPVRTCFWFASGGLAAARGDVTRVLGSLLETPDTGGLEPRVVSFRWGACPTSSSTAGRTTR